METMDRLAKTFKERLRAALADSGHGSKAALRRQVQISQPKLDRWLAGETSPDLEDFEQVVHGLGWKLGDLLSPGELPQSVKVKPSQSEALEALTGIPHDIFEKLGEIKDWEAVRIALAGLSNPPRKKPPTDAGGGPQGNRGRD